MSTQDAFAAALLDPAAPLPDGLRAWNGSDPAPRYAVHRNTATTSLVAALEDGFPVCRALVGPAFFAAMARDFVRAAPPASPVLLEYGAGFGEFIDRFPPAASLAFLGDMARLERARVESFNAADAPALGPREFANWLAAPETLMRTRASLHPSLRVLARSHCVLALWQAHQAGSEASLADALDAAAGPAREDLLVVRPELDVRACVLPPGAAAMFAALGEGASVSLALQSAAAEPDFDLAACVAVLVHHGALAALHPEENHP